MNIQFVDFTKTFLFHSLHEVQHSPDPYPATKFVPEWYKDLQKVDTESGLPTVKRCLPFLDAMISGYIIPLPGEITIKIEDSENLTINGEGKQLLGIHSFKQVAGSNWEKDITVIFRNVWNIITEPGWSCLFVSPLNREQKYPIEIISGIVDTDNFQQIVNFPAVIKTSSTAPGTEFTLPKEYPLVQVIPFKRENFTMDIRKDLTQNDVVKFNKFSNQKEAEPEQYRMFHHEKKNFT